MRHQEDVMAWDFSTEPEFEEKLAWMREFVRAEVFPLEDAGLSHPALVTAMRPLQEEVRRQGLWAAHLPPELGGGGFGQVRLGLMHEILGESPFAPPVFGNNAPDSGNAELLAHGGNEEQKKSWMQPLLDGDLRSAFSMTEPATPGADPTLLATRAVRDGNEYVIDGHKWFTTNGSIADILIVMVVTDPNAAPHRRASMIVVPADTPGVEIVRDIPTMEHPDSSFGEYGNHAEIRYNSVRVPAENLVGDEGDGFSLAQARLGPGRIHHCMRWIGQSNRAFRMLCERAVSRSVSAGPLSQQQMVQDWVATSAAEMAAARLLTLHAAWKIDNFGVRASVQEIAMIKYHGAKVLFDVIDRAIQVHGSMGFSTDLPLEQMYRAARAARIYDGPDEVHKVSVARRILRTYEPVAVPTDSRPVRAEESRRKFAHLLEAVS
jgi:acyl-CoA dehydrogenase